IYNETVSNFSGNLNKQISLGSVAKGVYLIELNSKSGREVKKVVVE
ncbi:MAG: T9SS type A sorting domain-containing protein, partial [Bacteroidetes bacterium]|nr:T9SS type A sorting domain-containing protein [Bacteroidota bacterium]